MALVGLIQKGKLIQRRWVLFVLGVFSPFSIFGQVSFSEIQALQYEQPNEIVKYGDDQFQFAEYWHPGTENPPLVILIHGGCWLNEYGLDHVRSLASELKSNNYAVWSTEYRRVGDPGGGWPGTFEDVIASINHTGRLKNIKQNARFLLGHSAGGHLALWAGAAKHFPSASNMRGSLDAKITGAIGLAAISDLAEYASGSNSCEIVTTQLMGGSPVEKAAEYGYASPSQLLPSVPTILIHGESDRIVSIRQSQRFADASVAAELDRLPDLGHFDMINPKGPAFHRILKALEVLELKSAE